MQTQPSAIQVRALPLPYVAKRAETRECPICREPEFAVGDRAVDDVDDEIDVEGDDLSVFEAAHFTEVDVLAEPCDSELSRPDKG